MKELVQRKDLELEDYILYGKTFIQLLEDYDESKLILGKDIQKVYRRSTKGTYYVYTVNSKKIRLIGEQIQEPTFSPDSKKVAYANMVCDIRPAKSEKYRVRLTIGGDVLDYYGDASSPAASLLETKLLINSVISTPGARFMSMDLKDHFLCTPMLNPECMKIPYKYFPGDDIKEKYELDKLVQDGYVYCKIKKGMYGLKQAAILAYDNMKKHLSKHRYRPILGTTRMWEHKTRKTKFCVCVDDFVIKYYNKEDLNHLLDSLRENYKCTVDMEGKHYFGLTFYWNYNEGYVNVAMPGYV